MDINMLKDFIKPELLILIPVLYAIGICLKKSEKVADSLIPSLIGIAGIILAGLWCLSTTPLSDTQTIVLCVFTAITQGVLCAAGSVFINQLIKQSKE